MLRSAPVVTVTLTLYVFVSEIEQPVKISAMRSSELSGKRGGTIAADNRNAGNQAWPGDIFGLGRDAVGICPVAAPSEGQV